MDRKNKSRTCTLRTNGRFKSSLKTKTLKNHQDPKGLVRFASKVQWTASAEARPCALSDACKFFLEAKPAVALRQRYGVQRWSRRESNPVSNGLIFNKLEAIT